MRKKLYLMRHGETMFNEKKKIQGWTDSPLTELGKAQALKAKAWFDENGIVFTDAACSTSERASDTLELVTSLPYVRLKGLKEMNFGKFDGESEVLNPPLEEYDTFFAVYGGGETRAQVGKRMSETLTRLMEQEGHESVFVVSHGGAIANFYRQWEEDAKVKKTERFYNCCVLEYTFEDGRFVLEQIVNPNRPEGD
ncbi:histidine phosphatase family protein [uncultured Dubosiella sp.]|uniref:histidine phosphatase family protein n=1 Tax=uncultured Dubosiella sp. TaxID=1937011 RepID=UPI0027320320|nr:histidine phosphatase family protein [uncultured Dubosiella sp.]